MNLSEERNYQRLMEALDAMELSEANRRLAEQYLDMTQPDDRELLLKTEHQDLSGLDKEQAEKCRAYWEYLKKRNRTEELERYVRFTASAGGSTAHYVFGWLSTMQDYLTKEQVTAISAEGLVWNSYFIPRVLDQIRIQDPKVLHAAMNLCYHKSNNAKTLLAALYLYHTKPQKDSRKELFSGRGQKQEIQDTVYFLEEMLIGSIPNLFTAGTPSKEDIRRLQSFVRDSAADAAFPYELSRILQKTQISEYLTLLLAGAAFLSIDHSERFLVFLRLTAAMDAQMKRSITLDICRQIGKEDWFLSHIEALEKRLPIPRESYVRWCLQRKEDSILARAIRRDPAVIRKVISEVSAEDSMYLMSRIQTVSPRLYQDLKDSYGEELWIKLAQDLTKNLKIGKTEAKQYLLGEAALDVLYPFVPEWRKAGWNYYNSGRCDKINELKKNSTQQQMYRRAVVLEGLGQNTLYFRNYWYGAYKEIDENEIKGIIRVFDEERVPVSYQLEALSAIHDSYYQEKDKTAYRNRCVLVLQQKKEEWEKELVTAARTGSAVTRFICIQVLDVFWQEYKEVLLSCAADSSRSVRELLAAVYESHKEWETDIRTMLSSRKSSEREMAVLVLKKWGLSFYQAELEAALEKEKSRKIKELLQSCLGKEDSVQTQKQAGAQTLEELAGQILKGGKKRKVSWAYETPFPRLHKTDGSDAPEEYLSAILVSYADMGTPGVCKDAARLASALAMEELSACMVMLFDRWMEAGAEAKKKWVLYAVSIHGGERIIPVLHAQIQEWPKASRGAMAAEAVRALALNGSSSALLIVEQISRKFKFRQVKKAAADALDYAAKQLGITKAELEDRIVPNLGFDEQMERVFDYGTRSFRVVLTPSLELEVYDENGRKLKNLPAPGKRDDPERSKASSDAFRQLKKQLKTVVSNQKLRLEQALSTERLWQVGQWKELFVKNPVMHQFATGLIWGLYENGKLKDTFRYMEDGSFNTMDEDEYEFPDTGTVGLVHPVELGDESLLAWKEQLSDYEVVQPVEQLERPVYKVMEEEKGKTELTRFGGKLLNGLSLSGKLQNQGWYRGSVQDGGGYYTFYREDGELGAELEFSGCYVADENEEVTVYGIQFYKAGTVKRGSYIYDTIKKENLYTLCKISPRYFSEIVLQLTKATASSQEQLAYPECKK